MNITLANTVTYRFKHTYIITKLCIAGIFCLLLEFVISYIFIA